MSEFAGRLWLICLKALSMSDHAEPGFCARTTPPGSGAPHGVSASAVLWRRASRTGNKPADRPVPPPVHILPPAAGPVDAQRLATSCHPVSGDNWFCTPYLKSSGLKIYGLTL